MFLIPLALSINILTMFGIWIAILFIILLALGILYEWRYNALDWSSEDKFFK
jgi:NADH:ubiquinone oxidoreductase subunit 3 (subunit A)